MHPSATPADDRTKADRRIADEQDERPLGAGHLDDAQLGAILDQLEASCSGRLGISARRLDTGETVRRHGSDRYRTASTVKVVVHAAVLSAGIAPNLRVPLRASKKSGGSGVLHMLSEGIEPTVEDLCTLMIVVSDNTATNMLIDLVGGVEAVNASTRALGFDEIVLHRRLMHQSPLSATEARPPRTDPIGPLGTATPDAFCALMAAVHAGAVGSPDISAQMLRTLALQQDRSGVPRSILDLPEPGDDHPGLPAVASKTGWIPGCRADVGILTLPGGPAIAYAVMADDLADLSLTPLSEGNELLGHAGAALARRWWPEPGPVGVHPGWPTGPSLRQGDTHA